MKIYLTSLHEFVWREGTQDLIELLKRVYSMNE